MADLNADALTTVEKCRRSLRLPAGGQTDELQDAINAYSRAIRHFTGREFAPRTPALDSDPVVERVLSWDGEGTLSLEPYEIRTVDSVRLYAGTASPVTLAATEWRPGPRHRTDEATYLWIAMYSYAELSLPAMSISTPVAGRALVPGQLGIGVSGRWGAGPKYGDTGSMVPPDVELACRIAVGNYFRNPEGFASRTLGELDVAELVEGETGPAPGLSLPRDARNLLRPYQRPKARMRYRTAGITA